MWTNLKVCFVSIKEPTSRHAKGNCTTSENAALQDASRYESQTKKHSPEATDKHTALSCPEITVNHTFWKINPKAF